MRPPHVFQPRLCRDSTARVIRQTQNRFFILRPSVVLLRNSNHFFTSFLVDSKSSNYDQEKVVVLLRPESLPRSILSCLDRKFHFHGFDIRSGVSLTTAVRPSPSPFELCQEIAPWNQRRNHLCTHAGYIDAFTVKIKCWVTELLEACQKLPFTLCKKISPFLCSICSGVVPITQPPGAFQISNLSSIREKHHSMPVFYQKLLPDVSCDIPLHLRPHRTGIGSF